MDIEPSPDSSPAAAIMAAASTRNGAQPALADERDRVAHLLRRAGFGASQSELDYYASVGLDATLDQLLNYERVQDDVEQRLDALHLDLYKPADLQRWWLLRMIYTRRPLLEKLTLFWHGLLVSGYGKVGLRQPKEGETGVPNHILDQNQFFRQHALDDFGTIMKGISRDPAMVIYLDSRDNRKGKPNENYAREMMELFTLGITGPTGQPNYTESDVREAARAFTGWGLNKQEQFTFNPNQHDPGKKTIFGQSGTYNGDEVIDLIMSHPSNAPYLVGRLWSFFAYPNADMTTLAPVIERYRATSGSIKATLQAIFTHPAFYSEAAYRAVVKSPAEFIAGTARALELETNAQPFPASAQRMGQTLFNPPNVAGWPGGARWFNTATWLERLNFVNRLLTTRRDDNTQPVNLLTLVQRYDLTTSERAVDYVLNLLLDGQVQPAQRQTLLDYAREGSLWPKNATALSATTPAVDRKFRGLIYLVMAMPEYQLA